MKIKGSLEQAVCIPLVIAHTKGHAPVKSYTQRTSGVVRLILKENHAPAGRGGPGRFRSGKKGRICFKKGPRKTSVSWMCSRPLRKYRSISVHYKSGR